MSDALCTEIMLDTGHSLLTHRTTSLAYPGNIGDAHGSLESVSATVRGGLPHPNVNDIGGTQMQDRTPATTFEIAGTLSSRLK
jgi:hypothetical protein